MRAELVDEVPVQRFAVFAEVAWLESRPELGMICSAARHAGGRITADVIRAVLPGVSDVGCTNLAHRCEQLRVCGRSGSLTELGEQVADTGRAPVPEQGVYDVWATDAELLGARILHIERLTSTRDGRYESITPLPVEPERDRIFTSVLDTAVQFVLRGFPVNHNGGIGVVTRPTTAHCRVVWVLDWTRGSSTFQLDGTVDAALGTAPVDHRPELLQIDLWALMEAWAQGPLHEHGQWDGTHRRLAVSFSELSASEQDSFTKDVDLSEARIQRFGIWDRIRLTDVPLAPASAADAQKWAMARLDRLLRRSEAHFSRVQVRQLFIDLVEGTPLEPFHPVLPRHDAMLAGHVTDPELFWRLAAPADLAPAPVLAQELDAMAIGAELPGALPALDSRLDVIWVPHPGGWSMGDLVDRLADGVQPRRLLLVDRHVSGDANLKCLELLIAALEPLGSPPLDVWTGDEVDGEAAARIEQATGLPPMRYREVFGRARPPHDRFFVVVPDHGTAFGWQLSHSLLHARPANGRVPTPNSPLRWNDMTATRLAVGQLREQMATWARDGIR